MNSRLKLFDSVPKSILSGSVLGGGSAAICSIVFFIALDKTIRAQNDISDGATRGIFSFIVGPIVTWYATGFGAAIGAIAGGVGRIGYEQIRKLKIK